MKIAIKYFFSLLVIFALAKVLFMLLNPAVYLGIGFGEYWDVLVAGHKMDLSVAGYFTAPLLLILMVAPFCRSVKGPDRALRIWYAVTSVLLSLIFTADTVLYSYWGFKLDTTPLFYFSTSPAAAFASAGWKEIVAAALIVLLCSVGFYRFLKLICGELRQPPYPLSTKKQLKQAGMRFIILILLFVPIRGGFTVSTMNLSSAYFSSDTRLNHAAVNPVFSLLYSATHADDFAEAFQFYSDEDAEKLFREITAPVSAAADTLSVALRPGVERPDVYLLILESFSSHLFPSLGGEPVALGLDSIASRTPALMFSNIYASSFRTDRALTAVLSAFPAQPTTSVMKHVSKAETLPSIASALNARGYTSEYYYGGDANFTNMKAYLSSTGFSRIVSDVDFPVAKRLSKWGAHDDVLFRKVEAEIIPYDSASPRFRVIQTSSSHEPFEVDFDPLAPDEPKEVTAFRFTDRQATLFIRYLSASTDWENSLVIIVPDHYGCYPKNLSETDAHRIPLIITGGALGVETPTIIPVVGSQTDIAATLLSLLGYPSGEFEYSRDLLSRTEAHHAFFSSRNAAAFAVPEGTVVLDLNTSLPVEIQGDTVGISPRLKAYLQRIYRDISKR